MNSEQEKVILKLFWLWVKCSMGFHSLGSKAYFKSWKYCKNCDQGIYL